MSKAAVLSWPFPVRISLLAREIQKQWELQQQWQFLQELGIPQAQQCVGTAAPASMQEGSPPPPFTAGVGCDSKGQPLSAEL